ncbi:MAG: NACHT domain-containing protein [Rhodopirellula sp.]|nr:NACHT domain-containing protein [Rhodopirellula sp.]
MYHYIKQNNQGELMLATLDTGRLQAAIASAGVSQSVVVQRSGISRAQLSRLVAGDNPKIRRGTLERLAAAVDVAPESLLVGGMITRYKRWLAEQTGYVDFRGFGMPTLERRPIAEIFVDTAVAEESAECREECSPQRPASRRLVRRADRAVSASRCVLDHDRVMVLGGPGGGKTTLLRFLAHSAAVAGEPSAEIPLYVRLPEFARAEDLNDRADLVKFLAARAAEQGCPDVEAALREELESDRHRCLVLLDGLDEVGNQDRRDRLVRSVQTLVEKYPRNRYAVTSRPAGFDSAPWRNQGFSVFRLLDYDREHLRCFAEKWATALSQAENKPYPEVCQRLNRAIFASPRVRALASNPLIVTILVLLNEARGGVLPRRRVDLYEKVVDVFLDTWESNKRSADAFEETCGIDLDAREFRWLLSDLSLAMQKAERTIAPRWWIAAKIEDYLQFKLGFAVEEAKDACDRILRYLAERTGLIEERGLGLFAFSHRTLQEYFASLGVIDEAEAAPQRGVTGCLRGYYFHPQWPEVVRLVAAQLTPPLAESLLASILDDPDPVGRFLRRAHLLALGCLSDGTSIADRRLVTGILDSLKDLGHSRWLGTTLQIIDALRGIEGTRVQDLADRTVQAILENARMHLERDDYDCLYQWAHTEEVLRRTEDELPVSFQAEEAAREVTVEVGDSTCRMIRVNSDLLSENPDKWYASACSLLGDPSQTIELKQFLAREMGRRVLTDRQCRIRLRKILCSEMSGPLRAVCAEALAAVTKGKNDTKRLLLRTLLKDKDEEVRRACAVALRNAAEHDSAIADPLLEILAGDAPVAVRAGAVRGLRKAAVSRPAVRETLQRHLTSAGESDDVRIACAWTLAARLADNSVLLAALKSWLQSPPSARLQRVAAELLATAMADERLDWDHEVMERAENVLMGLEDPCPCALDSLQSVATAREVRRGLRLENVLRDALRPLGDSIELAFVFGSTARNRQTQESDIDLLIIGGATLKSLSGSLRQAENVLGRRISPAIYTRDSFRERCQRGDPFLLDVCRREKIPVIQSGGKSSQKEFEDELRAMVAERMDSPA